MDIDISNPDALVNAGLDAVAQDDWTTAKAYLVRAIGLDHNHAQAHLCLAQVLLATGETRAGWMEYEWRNKTEQSEREGQKFNVTSAPWNGMVFTDGKLLVICDQGYGDVIQFARYLEYASTRVNEILLGCSEELIPVMQTVPGVGRCFHRWDEIPGHAFHCRISSLPYLLGTEDYYGDIAALEPYIHAPECFPLPPGGDRPRVGLAWAGRATHPHDAQRSLRLSQLAPLVGAPVTWVSLQKPVPDRDLITPWPMPNTSHRLNHFGDTARILDTLNLVITVDTAVAHLAGAMNIPVWVLLQKPSDWRWGIGAAGCDLYPSARLFRQPTPGDWGPVIEAVKLALEAEYLG